MVNVFFVSDLEEIMEDSKNISLIYILGDEMVYFGLKVVVMNGYVSGYPNNDYSNDFNCCLSAELTATAIGAVANNIERKKEYYKGVILCTPHPAPRPTRPAPIAEYYFAGLAHQHR